MAYENPLTAVRKRHKTRNPLKLKLRSSRIIPGVKPWKDDSHKNKPAIALALVLTIA
jgi:hypothetical protein